MQNGNKKLLAYFLQHQRDCMELYQHKLTNLTDEQKKESQHLLNLWITCCEQCYSQLVFQPDFQQVYGELINTTFSRQANGV